MKKTQNKKIDISTVKGQMKIQQMAFMIVALFIFFILVALFLLQWQVRQVQGSATDLNREATISSMQVIANMPELSCGKTSTLCLDEDKVWVMASGKGQQEYEQFWPVASVKVYKVYPAFEESVKCPGIECNYYEIYDNGQTNTQEYSTYISLCTRQKEQGYVNDQCEIAKLVVGVKIQDE